MRYARLLLSSVLLAIAALTITPQLTAQASTGYIGNRILNIAETHVNAPYSYGATGPYAYDCSGLVFAAATAAGERSWPRDTFEIAQQIGSRFSITRFPQRGDLALWGPISAPWHVELVTAWPGLTFGAETYGWAGRVYWHSTAWFRPWFYLHVNW